MHWPVDCLEKRTVFDEKLLTLAVRHGRYHAVEWLLDGGVRALSGRRRQHGAARRRRARVRRHRVAAPGPRRELVAPQQGREACRGRLDVATVSLVLRVFPSVRSVVDAVVAAQSNSSVQPATLFVAVLAIFARSFAVNA
ncbi:hypothetical protein DIPPA_08002 [Diplonema papillatum]|nr:hypothetical protein DIPPA_08002 [Diplonema papillatum]